MFAWITAKARGALRRASRPLVYAPHDGPRGLSPSVGGRWPGAAPVRMDWAVVEDRALLRHGWFSGLARQYAVQRDDALAAQACEALGRWLAADQPGVSAGWSHPSDVSFRLVHWAIGVGALGDALDPDLRRRLAGAARVHAMAALAELGHQPDDHRRVAHAAALALAGFAWPGLEDAARFRSEGLSWLSRSFPNQILADGSPRWGAPEALRVSAQLVVLCRDVCERGRSGLPAKVGPALEQASFFLGALGQTLPPFGAVPAEDLGVALGEAPPIPAKDWSILTFREGGWVIARSLYKGGVNRLVVRVGQAEGPWAHNDLGRVAWELGDTPILVDPGPGDGTRGALPWPSPEKEPPASLVMARQDGREVRVVVQRVGRRAEVRRDVLLAATRLVVTDRFGGCGPMALEWPLGPGLTPIAADDGWSAESGAIKVLIGFDGGAVRLADGALHLDVPGGAEVRVKSRFEVR